MDVVLAALVTGVCSLALLGAKWLIGRSERRIIAQNTLEHQFNLSQLQATHTVSTGSLDLLRQLQTSVEAVSSTLVTHANISSAINQVMQAHIQTDEATGQAIVDRLKQIDGRLTAIESSHA